MAARDDGKGVLLSGRGFEEASGSKVIWIAPIAEWRADFIVLIA